MLTLVDGVSVRQYVAGQYVAQNASRSALGTPEGAGFRRRRGVSGDSVWRTFANARRARGDGRSYLAWQGGNWNDGCRERAPTCYVAWREMASAGARGNGSGNSPHGATSESVPHVAAIVPVGAAAKTAVCRVNLQINNSI